MAERTDPTFRDELGKIARSAWLDSYLRAPGASESFLAWEALPLSDREPYCRIADAVWHHSIARLRSTIAELESHLSDLTLEDDARHGRPSRPTIPNPDRASLVPQPVS